VLIVGTMPDSTPAPGELRIRIAASGLNPGDIKKRQNGFGYGMPCPRIIPHSDAAGVVDRVGKDVSDDWIGRRVWCYGAQSYRPYGTAAEYVVVPLVLAVPLPDGVSFEQGACLGIPGITAHRAVHVAGPVEGRTVLVQGAAGAVGVCAVPKAPGAPMWPTASSAGRGNLIRSRHVRLNEIAVNDRGTFRGLTQFVFSLGRAIRQRLEQQDISNRIFVKEGFALHCSRPAATR
jgi:D-arabinose 1-dehydrogenase-like Zn-dependent alcohol dehydrogenase